MDKNAQLKRFHHDRRLQIHVYYFMHVYPDTMPVEDHLAIYLHNIKKRYHFTIYVVVFKSPPLGCFPFSHFPIFCVIPAFYANFPAFYAEFSRY